MKNKFVYKAVVGSDVIDWFSKEKFNENYSRELTRSEKELVIKNLEKSSEQITAYIGDIIEEVVYDILKKDMSFPDLPVFKDDE